MADSQVKDLTALTAPAMTDLVYVQADPSGTPVDRKVTIGNLRGCISSNTTLYVSPSGNDTTGDGSSGTPWRTVTKALAYLKDKWINTDVTVTISLADGNNGDHVYTSEIAPTHPCGSQITIKGANTHSKSMTSVQSSSGSAGNYSVILNLDSVADIVANDYVMISGAANGANPTYVMGIHKITNVDSGNTRITINSLHKVGVPSGAVTATVLVLKAVVNFNGCNGFVLRDGHHINLENLAIVGDGMANTVGVFAGGDEPAHPNEHCGGSVRCVEGTVGVATFASGYVSAYAGSIFARGCAASGASVTGVYAWKGGTIEFESGIATGNVTGVCANIAGALFAYLGTMTGNTTGVRAARYGYAFAISATVSGNTTNYSPAVNTQGNEYGYIDT